MRTKIINLKYLREDLPASVVVFLVALPLCMGIAMASQAPVISGLVAGVAGGIVVGLLSGSNLSVSGPAAGLVVTVEMGIRQVGSFEALLVAIMIAGMLQCLLGMLKAGVIGHFIPNSVIKGMLVAIGILLLLKQFPHLVGYDQDFEGDESFRQPDGENTFTEIIASFQYISWLAVVIGVSGLMIHILWDRLPEKFAGVRKWLPAPLLIVATGALINNAAAYSGWTESLPLSHMVAIPDADVLIKDWNVPDFSRIADPAIWTLGLTIALIASIESMLSVEATDKLDPWKRVTPPNRELMAQGAGNIVSGLMGGLPVTAVIVRSSANINAGGRTKLSAVLHAVLLMVFVALFPALLRQIPLASLAAILIYVGYKLARPSIFRDAWVKGWNVFIPFVITVVSILFTDLLIGVFIGLIAGVFFVFRSNYQKAVIVVNIDQDYLVRFIGQVTFMNKSVLKSYVEHFPENASVIFDYTRSTFLDEDIREFILEYSESAKMNHNFVEHRFLNEQQSIKLFPREHAGIYKVTA